MRDLIKDVLPLIGEEKKALAPGGVKLGTFRLRPRCCNHFATTTAQLEIVLVDNLPFRIAQTTIACSRSLPSFGAIFGSEEFRVKNLRHSVVPGNEQSY